MKIVVILGCLCLVYAAPAARKKRDIPAPIIKLFNQEVIPGKYIVKLKNDVENIAIQRILKSFPESADHVFDTNTFKGFSSALSAESLKIIQDEFDVDYIEEDGIVKVSDSSKLDKRAYVAQSNAPWGLARISSRRRGSTTYTYDSSAGTGTCAYIIDTGIYTAHNDFGGRAVHLVNYAGDGTITDGNGHGTAVAGVVGGTTYGVAKLTKLFAVKVLNAQGSGTNSAVIAGMNFVADDVRTRSCPKGAVANMSIGGSYSSAVNAAARSVVNAGVFFAVAAGGQNQDAANTSPASEPLVCTVGATTSSDARSSSSNYGEVIDVFAPGAAITSAWIGSPSATNTISGTSVAAAYVTGLGAYFLSLFGPRSPSALCQFIKDSATPGILTNIPSGTANLLIFNGNPSG